MEESKFSKKLKEKVDFYHSFDGQDSDDDARDVGFESSKQKFHSKDSPYSLKGPIRKREIGQVDTIASNRPIARSASDSNLVRRFSQAKVSTGAANHTENLGSNSKTSNPNPAQAAFPEKPPSSAVPRVLGKRKRSEAPKLAPEEHQIFKGTQFFFFPNNDAHPARRLRIIKALEFGSSWQKEWNDFVTHIIIDRGLDYASLMKFLKLQNLPLRVVLVNETWPSECIAFKALLDHKQAQFRVPGAPDPAKATTGTVPAAAEEAQMARSSASNTSLPLKPAARSLRARSPSTPEQMAIERTARSQEHVGQERREERSEQNLQNKDATDPSIGNTTEFDVAVSQAKALEGVPLDDEDLGSRPTSADGAPGDIDPATTSTTAGQTRKTKAFQDKFQCMQKHTGVASECPNAETIKILQQMADYYGQTGDEWRLRAYRKGIATLRNLPRKICTREEASALPNVGDRLAAKIEEIVVTRRLGRLENARADPRDQILQAFLKIYGVGFAQASMWLHEGLVSLDELLDKAKLTTNQRIGIQHYEHFNTRIPRAEVEKHGATVRRAMHAIDPVFEVIVGGSYRRGAEDSGDIDCVITHPKRDLAYIRGVVLDKIVPKLTLQGFLVAELSTSSREQGSKWHGASCLPTSAVWRRIDFLFVPGDEIGAAMIYFTGNDIFNRSLRLLASYKGMRLNQRGLYKDTARGRDREKLSEGTLVEGKNEQRIFEILGVPWREPWERII